jgi:hypothetical protein
VQHGKWLNKVIFLDIFAPLRTDASFDSQQDQQHHTGVSPFSQVPCGLVSNFPLDYMHLVCLGVTRRLLHLWVNRPRQSKLSQTHISTVTDKLISIWGHVPREFSRKPRSLTEYKLWKATELRLFLIYTGQVVLKGILPNNLYANFLDLAVAIRILLSPSLFQHYLEFADQLLRHFVATFCDFYSNDQAVYNVHSLIHLPEDVRTYGVLDDVSSFPFESFLCRIKKVVRRSQTTRCADCASRFGRLLPDKLV